MPIKFDTTIMRLIKDVNDIKAALRHVTTNLPLFDIANENTPASLSTNQNNYVPGNYDVLRINATANISITGFANGKKGRFLEIINVGTGRISFPDESASSIAINRIATPYDQTVTLLPNARARFYYDSTQLRWTVADLPNIQGKLGRFAVLSHSTKKIQTIPRLFNTKIILDTISSDEWGYWNNTSKRFVIPTGESGLYSVLVNLVVYDDTPEAPFIYQINANVNGGAKSISTMSIFDGSYGARCPTMLNAYFPLSAGDYLEIYFEQQSTGDVDIELSTAGNPVIIFSKEG